MSDEGSVSGSGTSLRHTSVSSQGHQLQSQLLSALLSTVSSPQHRAGPHEQVAPTGINPLVWKEKLGVGNFCGEGMRTPASVPPPPCKQRGVGLPAVLLQLAPCSATCWKAGVAHLVRTFTKRLVDTRSFCLGPCHCVLPSKVTPEEARTSVLMCLLMPGLGFKNVPGGLERGPGPWWRASSHLHWGASQGYAPPPFISVPPSAHTHLHS